MDRYLNWDLQGSILDPLIFNIFVNDLIMFIEKTGLCNFADDGTLYKSSPNLSVVLNWLDHDILIVLNRFKVNSLKANPQKFQFMVKKKFPIEMQNWGHLYFFQR